MNKFEMPKMDIAKFSTEDIITTSMGGETPQNPNLAAAKAAATGELTANGVSADNIFYFENPAQ